MASLTITGRADVAAAASGVDDLANSVRNLDSDVARVDSTARTSGAGLDTLAEASDNAASRSSQAAGGLGDLAGGLEAIGATGAAGALEGVALAAQTAVGAGDILNLVSETTAGRFVIQTAQTVASTVATTAQTVATTAMTAAQTAFNAVMAANPVALVVLAVVALAAGLVLAYKHSETFRDIVDAAFGKARDAVEEVVDVVGDVIDWFSRLPASARDAWDAVKEAVSGRIEDAIGKVDDLVDAVVSGPRDVASTVAGFFGDMFQPIQTAIGWVQDLIDKISSIDFPDFPDLNPLGRATGTEGVDPNDPRLSAWMTGMLATGPMTLVLKAEEQDKDRSMRTLVEALRDYFSRQGLTLSLTDEG